MAVNIRGLEGMGRVTSTIDGVRQNYRFTGHGPAGYTYVEPSLISGIDITKGAIATAGGAGTLAGAVNYRTLTVDDVLLPHEKAAAQITATFGGNKNDDMSITKAGGVRFDLAGNENGGSVFGAVNLTSVGNYEDGDGTLVNNSWRDVKSGLLKVSLSPNDEHRLDLGGVFYTTDFVANFYGQTVTNKTFTAKYAYTPDSNLIDLRVNGYLNRTQSEWSGLLSYDGRVMTTDALGFDVTNTSRWDFDGYGLKLDYGLEYYRDDFPVTARPTPIRTECPAWAAGLCRGPCRQACSNSFRPCVMTSTRWTVRARRATCPKTTGPSMTAFWEPAGTLSRGQATHIGTIPPATPSPKALSMHRGAVTSTVRQRMI